MEGEIKDKNKSRILFSRGFIFLAVILMLSVSVLGFFLFSYDKDVNYQVVGSQGGLLILVDFTDQILNVSQSLNSSQNLTLVNQNGFTNMTYVIDTNVTNLDPGNCTLNNDVSFELKKDAILIPNNTIFPMDAGVNTFDFIVTAVNNRVCPQNITNSLSFTEFP